ncbi:MAG: glycosyltransferase family 39 protein [Nanoarchaeota archaeon]|nr:glycosyltransferase family 39 protein [Nanoarchaeota archaeon]
MGLIKKFKSFDNFTKLAIIIILMGIILRFSLVIPYHIAGDACWQVSNARFMANNLQFPLYEPLGREQPFWSPPVFHIISAIFYKVFGIFGTDVADFGIKLVSPIFSSASLIFIYLILKNLFDKKIALYGVIFAAFLPISIDYGVFSYADSTLVFFVVASIYYTLKNRIIMSSLGLSLSILTKYTGILIIPLIIYIIFTKNKKSFLKKSIITLAITAVISLPWYIRNWIYLKNPVYPILNSVFHGVNIGSTYSDFDFSKLLSINFILVPFFEFFGVPDGNISNIFFFDIPFLFILLPIWLTASIIFISPIIFGMKMNKENRNIALILLVPFLLAGLLHIVNVGWSTGRRLLPTIVILAFFWGYGFQKVIKKVRYKNLIFIALTLVITGFMFIEFVKIGLAAKEWGTYQDDFDWVKQNTEKNAIFMAGGQCLSYNLNRFSYQASSSNLNKADYVWVNQDFKLDRRTHVDNNLLSEIKGKSEIVYKNDRTKTEIYRIKQ